jgi:hypothetical protein
MLEDAGGAGRVWARRAGQALLVVFAGDGVVSRAPTSRASVS